MWCGRREGSGVMWVSSYAAPSIYFTKTTKLEFLIPLRTLISRWRNQPLLYPASSPQWCWEGSDKPIGDDFFLQNYNDKPNSIKG